MFIDNMETGVTKQLVREIILELCSVWDIVHFELTNIIYVYNICIKDST